jgi:hypothetical protein
MYFVCHKTPYISNNRSNYKVTLIFVSLTYHGPVFSLKTHVVTTYVFFAFI